MDSTTRWEMQSSQQQQPRINVTDLKAKIVKKLGPERSKLYFYYLNRLLSSKINKGEFDKLCFRTLGRDNLPLHNQLILSILKNAHHAKIPPPIQFKEAPVNSSGAFSEKKQESSPCEDVHYQQRRPPQIQIPTPGGLTSCILSNGDVLSMSPRKARSGIRDRRPKDRPSLLSLHGKTDLISRKSTAILDAGSVKAVNRENGQFNQCDFGRPQHIHELAQQPVIEQTVLLNCSTRSPHITKSSDNTVSVNSIGPIDMLAVKDAGKVVQNGSTKNTRSLLHAPFGIPFCSASVGGARRTSSTASNGGSISFSGSGGLCDTKTLCKRMEQIAEAQGLDGVAVDCANLLNNGLDAYLKQLIRSCTVLGGPRFGHEPLKHCLFKQQSHEKLINGIPPGRLLQMQNSSGLRAGMQELRSHCPLSLLDFKVAMELNPQQLGEDWPLLLEKICTRACEE